MFRTLQSNHTRTLANSIEKYDEKKWQTNVDSSGCNAIIFDSEIKSYNLILSKPQITFIFDI